MLQIADAKFQVHLLDHLQLLGCAIFEMELGRKANIADTSGDDVDSRAVLCFFHGDEFIFSVDFTEVSSDCVSRAIIRHNAWEHYNGRLHDNVKPHT